MVQVRCGSIPACGVNSTDVDVLQVGGSIPRMRGKPTHIRAVDIKDGSIRMRGKRTRLTVRLFCPGRSAHG